MITRRAAKTQWYLVVILTLFTATTALAISRGYLVQDPMQEISLTLSASGFNPVEVRPQSGRFLVSIDNRSGTSDLVFKLSRPDGTLIRELRMSGAGGDWTESFDLPAGTYTLTESSHSTWVCTITVP